MGKDYKDMTIQELVEERERLLTANRQTASWGDAVGTASWGAAVGARLECIKEITEEIHLREKQANEQVTFSSPEILVTERGATHGDWNLQAFTAQQLKRPVREAILQRKLGQIPISIQQTEAVEMILVKISRIICGDPYDPDHWNDIQGYAELGKNYGPKK